MITIDFIQRLVAEHYGIPPEAMLLSDRYRDWAWPRQLAISLASDFTSYSATAIGKRFGGRDRATVFYACRVVSERARKDLKTLKARAQLRARLESMIANGR